MELTLNAVRLVKKLTEEEYKRSGAASLAHNDHVFYTHFIGTHYTLLYCLETFSQTEPEFAVELGNKVYDEWGKATQEDPIMFNLAATVECGPSNHYADMVNLPQVLFPPCLTANQVEYFHNNIKNRDTVVLSIHPHNDRGSKLFTPSASTVN